MFNYKPTQITCNSGGAEGSDTLWEIYAVLYGMTVNAFSYKTKEHKSFNKVEISDKDYEEGIEKIKKANKILGRKNIDKHMNFLARNWTQVKYSEEIFAIGHIKDIKKGIIDGGTGWAISMSILNGKTVYVFDQELNSWYKWSYIIEQFIKLKTTPLIQSKHFAGIGTRKLYSNGEKAIEDVFLKSFDKK